MGVNKVESAAHPQARQREAGEFAADRLTPEIVFPIVNGFGFDGSQMSE